MKRKSGVVIAGVVLGLAAALAACRPEEPRRVRPAQVVPTPEPTPSYFVHEITFRGQTLGRIARWYTGEFGNWKKLTRPVNPDLTVCCVPLRVGRRVNIPRELVVRTDPLPKPVTRKAPPLQKREPTPAPTEAEDEPEEAPEASPTSEATSPPAAEPTAAPEPTTAPEPTEAPEEEEDPLDIIGPR